MSLFPAYASNHEKTGDDEDMKSMEFWKLDDKDMEVVREPADAALYEASLLASDASSSDEEKPAPAPAPPPAHTDVDFYLDGKADYGNVPVSTLYYPGRPIYKRANIELVGGTRQGAGARGGARRRYFLQGAGEGANERAAAARELDERRRGFRALLHASPRDLELWLRFVRFQEEWGGDAAWLAACEEGARQSPARRLRDELQRARRAVLPHARHLQDLTADLHAERAPGVRLELWLRLAWALGGGGAPADVQRCAQAALADMPQEPRAYPHLFYVYGAVLRAAGLWEQLVLLIELACAMNFPASEAFPPPAAPEDAERLQRAEDEAVASGLPAATVWARVERLRAAAHWRPGAPDAADPQRAPAPADVAPLLRAVRPAASLLMCAAALRLAQVPLLPASEATRAAWGGAGGAEEADPLGAALPALWRARRRLRPGQEAGALRRSLPALLDPPHAHGDAAGHGAWARGLWEACCGWATGRRRLALACWRLRWLAALALLAEAAEARRLRAAARGVLRACAASEPVAYALFARMEADAGDAAAARRVALQAARAACGAEGVPREQALFCARVLREVTRDPALGAVALVAAALGRRLAPEPAPPAPQDLQDAAAECAERCATLERRLEVGAEDDPEEALCAALSCGAGEWQAARVALLPPGACLAELAAGVPGADASGGPGADAPAPPAVAWREARAVALAIGTRLSRAADQLHALFPANALLALAHAERPVWCGAPGAGGGLAGVLAPLLRAPLDVAGEGGALAAALARAAARAGARGAGGAALSVLRLEAEARGAGGGVERALLAALQEHPNHKWLYVRGAQWAGAQWEALADAVLERGLRAHALAHELRPLQAEPHPLDDG